MSSDCSLNAQISNQQSLHWLVIRRHLAISAICISDYIMLSQVQIVELLVASFFCVLIKRFPLQTDVG